MNRVTKIKTILTASNSEKIEALCIWIAENCDSSIGWDQLSKQSGFSHKELITLFQLYKQQTPMAFIRQVREQKKKSLPSHPQHALFLQNDKLIDNN
jgi:AraC-like DNA-binding protein